MEELDRLDDGQSLDEIGREELVAALARAALMGARGNSGVILSQIVRGAAEELASRPGELVDPVLVASAFGKAADAAYASVREPAEGTMLTVFREMAHSISRQLAHIEPGRQRLSPSATSDEQDDLLADVIEQAIKDGQKAVERTPQQLDVLAEYGVVDAGGYGLVLILAGVLAALRGEDADLPVIEHQSVGFASKPQHANSKFQYCTNFIVSGSGLVRQDFVGQLEDLGDSVLVVGDESTLKVHVHTDDPESAMSVFSDAGAVTNLDVADMRKQVAEREARMASHPTGIVVVGSGSGLQALFVEMGAHVVPGGETMNPSTSELLAGIREVAAECVLVLPNSSNVIMAAERACELSEKSAEVIPTKTQQEGLLALIEFDPESGAARNRLRLGEAIEGITVGGIAPAARDDLQGRFMRGDAVGFVEGEIVAWGGAGSTLASTIEAMSGGAELITVISGDGAPIPLDELDAHAPDDVELELHEGGQPSWWWLLAGQ